MTSESDHMEKVESFNSIVSDNDCLTGISSPSFHMFENNHVGHAEKPKTLPCITLTAR